MLFREGNKKGFFFFRQKSTGLAPGWTWVLMDVSLVHKLSMVLTGLMTQNNSLLTLWVKSTMFSVLMICSHKWTLMSLFMFTKTQDRQTWPENPFPFSWLPGWQVKGRSPLNIWSVAWKETTMTTPLLFSQVQMFSTKVLRRTWKWSEPILWNLVELSLWLLRWFKMKIFF